MATEPLESARKAQRAAESALERMRAAKSFAEFDVAWNEFLTWNNKVWTRAVDASKASRTRTAKWRSDNVAFRRSDPLLQYLEQARHADEHAVADAIEHQPSKGSLQIPNPPGGGPGYISHLDLSIIQGKPIVHGYQGNAPLHVSYTPARLILLPVVNRRVRFEPPAEHMGAMLEDRDPFFVAELGVKFTACMLDELQELIAPPS